MMTQRVININDFFSAEYEQRAQAMDAQRQERIEARRQAGIAAREAQEQQARLHAAIAQMKPNPVATGRTRGQRKDHAAITSYVRDRIVAYRMEGAPVAMIAHYLGVSKTSVRRVLREQG